MILTLISNIALLIIGFILLLHIMTDINSKCNTHYTYRDVVIVFIKIVSLMSIITLLVLTF